MFRAIKDIFEEYGSIIFIVFIALLLLVNAITVSRFYTDFKSEKALETELENLAFGIKEDLNTITSQLFIEIYSLKSPSEYSQFSNHLIQKDGFIQAVDVRNSSGALLYGLKKRGFASSLDSYHDINSWRLEYIERAIQSSTPAFSKPYLRFEHQNSELFPRKYVELIFPTRSHNVFILTIDLKGLIDSLPVIIHSSQFIGLSINSPGIGQVSSYGLIDEAVGRVESFRKEVKFQGLNLFILAQGLNTRTDIGASFLVVSGAFTILLIFSIFVLIRGQSQKNKYLLNLRAQEGIMLDQSKFASLGEISTIIAHEINQPLATMELYIGSMDKALLSDPVNTKTLGLASESFRKEIARIANIIRNIQAFVTSDSKSEDSLLDVGMVVSGLEPILKLQAKNFYCTCAVRVRQNFSAIMNLTLFEQVILNLSRNAFEAMSEAHSPVRSLSITLDWFDDAGRIQILDTGPGIPEDSLHKIGTSFFSTKKQNFGIGISMCKSMMERYGGNIVWRNGPVGGAEFTILLHHAKRINNSL